MILAMHATLLFGMAFGFSTNNLHRRGELSFSSSRSSKNVHILSMEGVDGNNDRGHTDTPTRNSNNQQSSLPSQAEQDVLQLAQSHFVSQALLAVMRLGVLDVLEFAHDVEESGSLTVDEIITRTNPIPDNKDTPTTTNRDALFRCLRLICTAGVVKETAKNVNGVNESAFSLTEVGQLLQQPTSNDSTSIMAPFVSHWAELPLWNSWSQLPDYVAGKHDSQASSELSPESNLPPFDRANGMSASDYYANNAESCSHRNSVARYASSKEITSILDTMECSSILNASNLARKTIVDIGGGYGDLMNALKESVPSVGECYCLDLPNVIDDAISANSSNEQKGLTSLVPGDMFDPSTIPSCDYIFTKHVLCDFSDEDVVRALQSFHNALSKEGKVVIMDAVLPNGNDLNGNWNAAVSFDVLLMLSGRRGERSRLEWSNLAEKAGFEMEEVLSTSSVTVDLAILSRS